MKTKAKKLLSFYDVTCTLIHHNRINNLIIASRKHNTLSLETLTITNWSMLSSWTQLTWHFTHTICCPVSWPSTVKAKFLLRKIFLSPIKSGHAWAISTFVRRFLTVHASMGLDSLLPRVECPKRLTIKFRRRWWFKLNWTPQGLRRVRDFKATHYSRKSQLCQSSSLRTKSPRIPGNLSMVRATFPFTLFNFPRVSSDWTLYNNRL